MNLSEVNDRASHMEGQTALRNFSRELQHRLRLADVCCRYELDKVMVLLPNTNMEQARLACEKLSRDMNMDEILEIQPYPGFCFQVSAGFVEAKEDSLLEKILASAQSEQSISYEFRVC